MENVPMRIERFTFDIIYYVLWIVEVILLLRFMLKLLGANASNEIIMFLYSISSALMGPFKDIFDVASVNNMVLEPSVLIAMVFYAVIAYLLISFIKMMNRPNYQQPTQV